MIRFQQIVEGRALTDDEAEKVLAAVLPKKRKTTHWKAVAKAAQLATHDRDIDFERVSACLDAESDAVRASSDRLLAEQRAHDTTLGVLANVDRKAARYLISAIIGWLLFVGTLAAYARVVFR